MRGMREQWEMAVELDPVVVPPRRNEEMLPPARVPNMKADFTLRRGLDMARGADRRVTTWGYPA